MSPTDRPHPPCNVRALDTNRDYIVVGWDAPETDGGSPITSYIIEKRDAKRSEYIYIADVDANTFQYKVSRLFEGYQYFFRVFAENQVGPSEPCEMSKPVKAKLPFGMYSLSVSIVISVVNFPWIHIGQGLLFPKVPKNMRSLCHDVHTKI